LTFYDIMSLIYMPVISQFYGIKIYIYYDDHNEPHFHAIYGEFEAEVAIKTGKLLDGKLPPNAKRLVNEWIKDHGKELEENWKLAVEHKTLKKIEPLA